MYGMVNEAVRGLVKKHHGDEVWHSIHTTSKTPESFVKMESYDDDMTYRLVTTCSKVLKQDPETILRTFGAYWISDVATVHYGDLMNSTGSNFATFLKNLDHMHQGMKVVFPDYHPPSFRVIDIALNKIQVDYYSKREGLLPFVEGLFEGLAKHFSTTINIEHIPDATHQLPCKRMMLTIKDGSTE